MSKNSIKPSSYNFPFRTNYEFIILFIWLVSAILSVLAVYIFDMPPYPYYIFAGVSILIGAVLGYNGVHINARKENLKGYPLTFIDVRDKSTMKLFGIKDSEVLSHVKNKK